MEEKNSGFSLNRRLLRALRRRARGEGGVTLVEMMVSLFIFAIVSTMFTVSIVQYLHSTTADAIRTRSATEIARKSAKKTSALPVTTAVVASVCC